MGRDLATALQLENLTRAASEHKRGLTHSAGCVAASSTAAQHARPGTLTLGCFVKQRRYIRGDFTALLLSPKRSGVPKGSMDAALMSLVSVILSPALLQMPQEQYTHHRSTMPSSEGPQVYKVGIYGWRKRCLYFFVLLLMILILVNLAMTIWILKVMNFTIDGMGNLRITEKGLKLEGDSEFLQPLYAKEIQSRPGNALYFKSARNVTVNILNDQTKVLTQLITGPKAVEAYGKKFEVKTVSGKLLFSADDNEVVVGAERLRVLGKEILIV
ncbi:Delta-sarcoglycan [Fukomys damarensis]|uniref:Delta-sarcoglycan n=1 Tax=Fukomys damarensis TaxID=885580 RepID=A0A091E3G1_FUKDA|nr:Delta-sarcoglycan [Fukomys damarensis]